LRVRVSRFGSINPRVRAVYERPGEIGMLRAIGTTRSQVRWMIRWERVITANGITNGTHMVVVNRVGVEGPLTFYGSSFVSDPVRAASAAPCSSARRATPTSATSTTPRIITRMSGTTRANSMMACPRSPFIARANAQAGRTNR